MLATESGQKADKHLSYDVFISYSRKDTKIADKVCNALSEAGYTYFIDREGISAGTSFTEVLAKAIDESRVFLFLAGSNAYKSKFTASEVLYAFKHKKPGMIIPYILDDTPMPSQLELLLGTINWLEMRCNPVETSLMLAVKSALNEEYFIPAKRKRKKSIFLAVFLFLLIGGACAGAVFYLNKTSAQKRFTLDKLNYESYIRAAESMVTMADVLKNDLNSTANTTNRQISCLLDADAAVIKADSVKLIYSGSNLSAAFGEETKALSSAIRSRLDSMFIKWSGYARNSYELYQAYGYEDEAQYARECASYALRIYSDDELIRLRDNLR